MKVESKLYQISETAYRNLYLTAMRQGYVKSGLSKARGMSQFIIDMSLCTYYDTRPSNVVDRHNQEIAMNRAPKWTSYIIRKARMLTLSQEVIDNYIVIAYQFGIMHDPPYAVGGPSILQPVSIVGYVLEGIGLKWLTPEKLPVCGLNNVRQDTITERVEKQKEPISNNTDLQTV